MFSMEDSSMPFRAFLGAILSVQEGVAVQPSVFNPDMELDIIPDDEDNWPLPEDDIDDGSGLYRGSSRTSTSLEVPMTRSRVTTSREAAESGLMVRPIPGTPVSWLTRLLVDYFLLPTISRSFPSMGAPSSAAQQHICSSTLRRERKRETAPMVDPPHRIWVDWKRLGMLF